MLEVACSRCERHGRLSVAKLIERHGADAQLTNLRTVLAGDGPRIGGAIYEQCSVHYPQLGSFVNSTRARKTCRPTGYGDQIAVTGQGGGASQRDSGMLLPRAVPAQRP
jgi:hypothetical protein